MAAVTDTLPRASSLPRELRRRSAVALGLFVVIAYALSWAWTLPLAVGGDVIEKGSGWPTHVPALVGPAIAAFVATAWLSGRAGLADLLARMGRWRMRARWWLAALSPLAFLVVALAVAAAVGKTPALADFGRYSGLPSIGVIGVALLATLINGFGEETGWRGFALPMLQLRFSPLIAALLVTPIWAGWHLPFFFTVATYRDLAPPAYIGFVFGIGCGSIVLTWLYNRTGGSILACAVWHGTYNLTTATVGASGVIAAVTTSLVVFQAMLLLALELRARRHGGSVLAGVSGTKPTQSSA